jgi:hypothetical protein
MRILIAIGDSLRTDLAGEDHGRRPPRKEPRAPGGHEGRRQGQEEAEEARREEEGRAGQLIQPVVDPVPGVTAELSVDRDVVEVGEQEPGQCRHAEDDEDACDVRQPGTTLPHRCDEPERRQDQ